MTSYLSKNTPLGYITVYSRGDAIVGIRFEKREGGMETPVIANTFSQLDEYFRGERKSFDIPVEFHGTDFQMRVWKELMKIPYGEVISYKELARRLQSPKAYRGVGNANGKNPLIILAACHRVIGADGSIGGYSAGIEKKIKLLEIEGVEL